LLGWVTLARGRCPGLWHVPLPDHQPGERKPVSGRTGAVYQSGHFQHRHHRAYPQPGTTQVLTAVQLWGRDGRRPASRAIALLNTLLTTYELPRDQRRRIQELQDICTGFDAWDRFDHLEAWSLLSMTMNRVQTQGLALKRVLSSRAAIDPEFTAPESIPGHGYELVEDLLLNAQRRAHQQRYDDAVGRLYRALELLAQIHLNQKYNIITGDIDLTQLPESLRDQYAAERNSRTGKVQIPLWKSYTLLSQLSEDPLGSYFQTESQHLLNALEIRNNSLFAHGFQPITANDYQGSGQVLQTFIEKALEQLIPAKKRKPLPQFPIGL
jgi:CRISPR-associated protein (TIGR02710 family)